MTHLCDLVTEVIGAAPAVSEAILGIVTQVRSGDQETASRVQSVIVHDSIVKLKVNLKLHSNLYPVFTLLSPPSKYLSW